MIWIVDDQFQQELNKSGLGGLGGGMLSSMLMNPPADQPWLSPSPGSMLDLYADMLNRGATAKEQQAAQDHPEADAQQHLNDLTQLKARSQILAPQTINDRPAIGVFSDGLNQTQVSDGQEFTLNTVSLWVDAERHVPLRLKMDGVMQSHAISIERDDLDYRAVPGCGDIYKPSRSVMRIAGIMSPKEQAEMSKAQAQLAEFEKQMAQMPESQRDDHAENGAANGNDADNGIGWRPRDRVQAG
jgi:hypothetical protein